MNDIDPDAGQDFTLLNDKNIKRTATSIGKENYSAKLHTAGENEAHD